MKKPSPHSHSHETRPSVAEALEIIESSEYRLTRPRRALLDVILKQTKPFSVASLEKMLKGKNGCDLVTIYRTLPVFVELGLIEKCDFADDVVHYEVTLGDKAHHHHHVVCISCKKVEPLEFCIVDIQETVLRKLGYSDLRHRLEFSGRCPKCS